MDTATSPLDRLGDYFMKRSKGMRDTVCGVEVDVLCAGEFPGDGQPKPIVFPDPATVAVEDRDGLPIVPLRLLLELKLANGMTAPHRLRDLDDVIRLIQKNGLPPDYEIDPYVRGKFDELWLLAQIDEDR